MIYKIHKMAKKSIVKFLILFMYNKTLFWKKKQYDYILFSLNNLKNFVLILFSSFSRSQIF